ncbi:helix-turn-helix transcriptional regulator [Halobacillus sp. GSS1]|uniref:helix-turn-helix domain-containing protein n=1 Tax=Halobacillus sp. GSS1 TaxID=2815919 RepID=UPI001A8C9C6A|nr:helix-turn-helix transcriptional regulator [Halobacillus sp. GSS1]MBN9655991.1 helix-turn-helix transcriptional regulator [Halobacillus sp. GSS1]
MTVEIKCTLKEVLDKKGWSIRELAKRSDCKFESVRRLYNDDTMRFQRDTLAKVCETLEIDDIGKILKIVDVEK